MTELMERIVDDLIKGGDADLYQADLYAWTQQQAALLRSGCLASLDVGNVLEEIESLGLAQANALRSRYAVLSLHLLKLKDENYLPKMG